MADPVTALKYDNLTNALTDFVKVGRDLLQNAETESSKDGYLQEFVSKKIGSLFGIIAAGATFLNSLSVKKLNEAEDQWTNAYHCAEVRSHVEELLELEADWDGFLQRLDGELQMSDTVLCQSPLAESMPAETPLMDVRSGESVTLGRYLGKELEANQRLLEAGSVRVLVISFGSLEGARYWLQDTDCKYDMLLDPQRKVYSAFGLGSSYAKVLKFNSMLHYAEFVTLNRVFPQAQPNVIDDIYQLGGDFVLDEAGRVTYSHPSKGPLDRPAAVEILAAIAS